MEHLALIGMMAVGKSTTGRAVAEKRGARFVDTDELIEARTGLTPRELWQREGEEGYRPLEREAVRTALASADPVVLATPGGVAVDPAMAALVSAPGVTAVYLRASAETLARRVGAEPKHRPLLGEDPGATLARLLDERSARYTELADRIVDVDGRTPGEVATAVLESLAP